MKRRSILDEIIIESPCTASWDAMNGTNKIRYCSECHKYVYNLSEMTRREAESLVTRRGNNMCARMIKDLEGQTLTVESLPPLRLFGWKPGPIANAVVSALISITPAASPSANGQLVQVKMQDISGRHTNRPTHEGINSAIAGIVSNERGEVLAGAVVTLISEASGEALSQITNEGGEFRFDGLASRTYVVEIKANTNTQSKKRLEAKYSAS